MWVYVTYTENPDRSASFDGLPVTVRNLAPDLVIVDQNGAPRPDQKSFSQVNVTVKTDKSTLSTLSQRYLSPFIDLEGIDTPGDHAVKVQVELADDDIRVSDFSLIETEPEFLSVRFEKWITATVPLTIDVQGNLPFSFERGDPQVTFNGEAISKVDVEGPENRVGQVASARATANIEQLRANYVSSLQLTALDKNNQEVSGINLSPSVVRVYIPIRSVVGLKRVPVLGNIEGSPAPGYVVTDIRSDPQLVSVSGSSGRLDEIDRIETTPISINGRTGVFTERVALVFPPGVSRHFSEESHVEITVTIEPLAHTFQVVLPFTIDVVGIPSGWIASLNPRFVQVPIAGPEEMLSQITPSQLFATIDMSGETPGVYTRVPNISLPEGFQLAGDIPSVEVTISAPATATPQPTPQPPTATPSPENTPTEEIRLPPTLSPVPSDTPSREPPTPTNSAEPLNPPTAVVEPTIPTEEPTAPPTVGEEETPIVDPDPIVSPTPEQIPSPPLPVPEPDESTEEPDESTEEPDESTEEPDDDPGREEVPPLPEQTTVIVPDPSAESGVEPDEPTRVLIPPTTAIPPVTPETILGDE
jgi:YbbR domain-containing protein